MIFCDGYGGLAGDSTCSLGHSGGFLLSLQLHLEHVASTECQQAMSPSAWLCCYSKQSHVVHNHDN
jgi:predicted alpha/beta superfamily hydrolase